MSNMDNIKQKVFRLCKTRPFRFMLNEIVTLTVRVVADEFQRNPYGTVTWLGRYQGTVQQFAKREDHE